MKLYEYWVQFVLCVMLVFTLAGCGSPSIMEGQVLPLQPGSTLVGIKSALNGETGTVVLTNGDKVFLGWKQIYAGQPAFGFACANCNIIVQNDPKATLEAIGGKGNLTGVKDFSNLVDALKNSGWTATTMKAVTSGKEISHWLASVSKGLVTFLVLPVINIPTEGPQG